MKPRWAEDTFKNIYFLNPVTPNLRNWIIYQSMKSPTCADDNNALVLISIIL